MAGDPVACVGYTLVTRDKAQTFKILNAELRCVFCSVFVLLLWVIRAGSPRLCDNDDRPLANEARLGRGGTGGGGGGGGGSSRLSRALSGSAGGGSKGKVAIVNAEEAALEVGGCVCFLVGVDVSGGGRRRVARCCVSRGL